MSKQLWSRHWQLLLLVVTLVLAGVLRLWQLDSLPPGLYHDEAYNGLDALSLLRGEEFPRFYEGWELYAREAHGDNPPTPTRWPLFFEGNYGREPLHVYLMALSIAVFGPTPFAIRLVPALAGVLAVLTTYLAAQALCGRERRLVPIGAALALAILLPVVHFSRFGIRPMLFLPLETLTVFFFWKALRHPRWSFFALAGFCLGLSIYTYAAARLFPLLFVLFIPLWLGKDRAAWRHYALPFGLMAAVAALVAAPLLWFFARYPYFFVFRIAYVANRGRGAVEGQAWLTWLLNVGRVTRGLFWQGETHLRHNLPGRPYLDPIQSLLFLTGLVVIWKDTSNSNSQNDQKAAWRPLFLLLWLLIMLLPSILSGDAPHFGRLSGAAPPIAILIGWGVSWLFQRVPYRLRFLLTLLLLGSLLVTIRDYFIRYANHPNLAHDFYLADWQLGQFLSAQAPETSLYLAFTQEEMATIYLALADPERLQSYNGGEGVVPAGQSGQPAIYVLRPTDVTALSHLQTTFPAGQVGTAPGGFLTFTVPADVSRIPTATRVENDWQGQIGLRGWSATWSESGLAVTLAWKGLAEIERDYTAYVHLLDKDGNLVAQQDRPPAGYPTSDWQPGELVIDQYFLPLLPGEKLSSYTLQTGFYYVPVSSAASIEALGQPVTLGPAPPRP